MSDGEKKVLEILTAYKNQILERKPFTYSFIDMQWAINSILDLYNKEKEKNEKQQKEIDELKEEIDYERNRIRDEFEERDYYEGDKNE